MFLEMVQQLCKYLLQVDFTLCGNQILYILAIIPQAEEDKKGLTFNMVYITFCRALQFSPPINIMAFV